VLLPEARWWLLVGVAAAVTVAGELALVSLGLHGFGALLLSGIPALAGWALVATSLRQGLAARSA
jgi:hypothetical protein